jgi:hypothetical protein
MKMIKLSGLCRLTALALLAFIPAGGRADTLYATRGNSLFQFNSALGAGSQSTITNFPGSATTTVAVDSHGNIFVATGGNDSTDWGDIYEITTNGMHTVATGLYQPQSLAVDSRGNLFELDGYTDSGQNINECINTGGTLSSTPVTFASEEDVIGPGYPLNALAFDSAGDLFVASGYGTYKFTNNAGTLSSVATLFSSDDSFSLAFDSSGNLFLGSYGIVEYVNAAGTLSSTPVTVYDGGYAYGMAFDSHDNLFVSDIAGSGNLYELTNNAGTLSSTPGILIGGFYASSLAFLPVAPPSKLYVAGDESIYSFAPPAGSASERTVASSLPFEPAGMAVDGQGNLFASDGNSSIYEIPKNGVPVVFASGLNDPTGLAFDTNGDLFESDMGSFSLNEFINTAGTLSSTPTPLPIFDYGDILVFDHSGDLFVQDSGSVLEYANIGGTLSIYPEEPPFSVDGIPSGLVFDANGDLFISYPDGDYNEPPYTGVILEFANNNSTAWYNGSVLSSTPITIASGNVAGLTCDPSGNLYEVDGDTGNVYEIANNNGIISSSPTLYAGGLGATCETMNSGVQTAAASKPNLYVGVAMSETDPAPNAPAVFGFNSTNGAATKTLVAYVGCCNYPLGSLAFDNSGNLFVSDTSTVFELTNNAGTLSSTQIEVDEEGNQLGCGGGVAFDFSGNLFVGDFNYAGVNKFTPAGGGVWNNFPLGDPNPFLNGAGYAYSLAFDNNRANLFAAGAFGPEGTALVEFGNLGAPIYQTSHLVFPASQYGIAPQGLAVDRNGNLYVGESGVFGGEPGTGNIVEYTNTPSGVSTNETLFASGLSNVTGLAFDASGNLFESDGNSGNVYEFINTDGVLSSTPILFASGLGDVTGLAFAPGAPVPPQLTITFYGPTTSILSGSVPASVVLSWPSSAAGFELQTNGSLALPNWADYDGTVQSNQGTNSVTIKPLIGNLFFRLKQ